MSTLYYGDNLTVMRNRKNFPDESVDLVCTDPPFNSNKEYNVIAKAGSDSKSTSQSTAFSDTWKWSKSTEKAYESLSSGKYGPGIANLVTMLKASVKDIAMMAYIVMLAPRLVEGHRVLKKTGSIYVHCDPAASHYIKMLMDVIFGFENFRSEIIWKRSSAHSGSRKWMPIHDILLFYSKSDKFTWNHQFLSESDESKKKWYKHKDDRGIYKRGDLKGKGITKGASGKPWRGFDPSTKGRHWAVPRAIIAMIAPKYGLTKADVEKMSPQECLDLLDSDDRIIWPKTPGGWPMLKRYLSEANGVHIGDVITDIRPLSLKTAESLGYPTQKPLKLYERMISASSNKGDVVLDIFAGCGTTIEAAEKLGRKSIGIDTSFKLIELCKVRLQKSFGAKKKIIVRGVPSDLDGAIALFEEDPLQFQRWVVEMLGGEDNPVKPDRGCDGWVRFDTGYEKEGMCIISVKGGKNVSPSFVRDLIGAVALRKAEMGVLVVREKITEEMANTAKSVDTYVTGDFKQSFQKIQILTVSELLSGKLPNMPRRYLPYYKTLEELP